MANPEINSLPHDEENRPPNISQEYPELESLRNPKNSMTVAYIYVEGISIDSYIESVKINQPSVDIEHRLKTIETSLNELAAQNKPEYQNFIQKETEKLEHRKAEATQAIGDKKIGSDHIYK